MNMKFSDARISHFSDSIPDNVSRESGDQHLKKV